jgi:hypothetical protein
MNCNAARGQAPAAGGNGRGWRKLVGKEALHVVRESGRKFLFTNH